MSNRIKPPKDPILFVPNVKGSTIKLAVFALLHTDDETDRLAQAVERLGGNLMGYIIDREREDVITLQFAEGHPDHDLRWARRTIVDGMEEGRVTLQELSDGTTVYFGEVGLKAGEPRRFEFFLTFSAEDES